MTDVNGLFAIGSVMFLQNIKNRYKLLFNVLYCVATLAYAFVNYEIDNIACDFGSRMTISNCCR